MGNDLNTNQSRTAARTVRSTRPGSGVTHAQARNSQGAQKSYERYLILARAKALAGDQIEAENYYQHAEHYLRSMNADAS